MGFSPIPAGLRIIVPTIFAYPVQCAFARCRLMEENVDGLLFLHGLRMRKWLSYFSCRCSWRWLLETLYIVSQKTSHLWLAKTLIHMNTTATTVLRPFVWDYPGEPVPEETLTHPPSWSSSNFYQLLPSTTIHNILAVQITKQDYIKSKVGRFWDTVYITAIWCYLQWYATFGKPYNRYLWLYVVTVAGFGYGYGIWIAGLGYVWIEGLYEWVWVQILLPVHISSAKHGMLSCY